MTWFDIDITKTLLDKKDEELTDIEKEAIKNFKDRKEKLYNSLKESNEEIRANCPILCSGYDKSFIPSPGWIYPIKNFCYALEALNIQYKKYGIKVTSSQNKSKFGTYRCYYDIECTPCGIMKYPLILNNSVSRLLSKVNYGVKYIETVPSKVTIEWREISKEDYETKNLGYHNREKSLIWDESFFINTEEKNYGNNSKEIVESIKYMSSLNPKENNIVDLDETNVFKIENNKYFYAYELHHGRQMKRVITKHKFLNKISKLINNIGYFIEDHNHYPKYYNVMREDFSNKVEELYHKVDLECQGICEECGRQIGDDYSPICTTHGWIAYLCEECAASEGSFYTKDNKSYKEYELC